MLLGAYNGLLVPVRTAYTVYRRIARLRGIGETELQQRLGHIEPLGNHPLWIQAASVGEAGIAAALVGALRRERPSLPFFVTTTTRTGQEAASRALPQSVQRGFFPLDFRSAVRRALDAVRPSGIVLVETELWPNLLLEADARSVPVVVVNGRLSDRAFRRCRWAAGLFARSFRGIRLACVQTALDRDRFAALGLPLERIRVTGNIKFAASGHESGAAEGRARLGLGLDEELWVAGSTAEGEEEAVLAAFRALGSTGTRRVLVIAPRRPERFEDVGRLIAAAGLPWRRRSDGTGSPPGVESRTNSEVLLLDSIGELASLYSGATAAFVGGTLSPLGGHNIIEPAARGVAPVFGPHVQNVRDVAARLLEAGGAFQVQDAPDLARTFARLASDPELRRRAGASAREVVVENAGALEATLREIRPFLRGPVPETA